MCWDLRQSVGYAPSNHWSSNHLGHLPRSQFCFALRHQKSCHRLLQSFTRMGQSPSMMRRRQLSFKSVTKRPLKAWLCTLKKGRSSRECVASEEMVKLGINPFIPDELILTRFLRGP